MPTTVAEAFAAGGLVPEGVVRWNEKPKVSGPGVYIISMSKSAHRTDEGLPVVPLAPSQFSHWLTVCPKLTLDRLPPTERQLQDRIQRFWIPDESILYIGQTTRPLSNRLGEYYDTPIGLAGPHSGGYFLKLLSNLDLLWVHYARSSDPKSAEEKMLRCFCENVSNEAKQILFDPDRPFPFANLEWPKGTKKKHGLRGTRVAKDSARKEGKRTMQEAHLVKQSPTTAVGEYRTQKITQSDIEAGKIRIPSSGRTKSLFPGEKEYIEIILNGTPLRVRWDPQIRRDKVRSGLLGIGVRLRDFVRENEILSISVDELGIFTLDSSVELGAMLE